MDTRPLLSLGNNAGPHNINDTAAYYIKKVMLGSFPKMLIILCCIVIAAYTTELAFGQTHTDYAVSSICYDNPKAKNRGPRICISLMAGAISSILVAMFLMNFDILIPWMGKLFRRVAHGLSLLVSIVMSIMLLVTSSLMANLYVVYCHYLEHQQPYYYDPPKCGQNDERYFLILPIFGFITMVVWGLNGWISFKKFVNSDSEVTNNTQQH